MKVAYFSPLPPEQSGIADYSAHLLPALEKRIDVEVARRGSKRRPRGADAGLYHIGNNADAHAWIVEAFRREPGLVVLHDVVLHHLVAGITIGRGRPNDYLDAMQRDSGIVGRLLAHGVLDGLLPSLWEDRAADFPLAMWVIEPATGVIVHSRFAEERVRELGYKGPVWRVPMPAWPVPAAGPPPERDDVVIGCFGHMNTAKRIPELLDAFARLLQRRPGAKLILGGSASTGLDVEHLISQRGLEASVDRHGYLDEEELWRLISDSDVLVNLRHPTMGETSGMVVRALSIGKPLVVSDLGWFAELPDEVALKVPVDEGETEALDDVLDRLAGDPDLRLRMSESAAEWARNEHDLETAAELYVATIEESVGARDVERAVVGDVARAASEVGLTADSPELGDVAGRLKDAGLGASDGAVEHGQTPNRRGTLHG
jgi:glycosyltransferase involved in cell wall biosynthesis